MGKPIIPTDYLDAIERQKLSLRGADSYASFMITPEMVSQNVYGHVLDALIYANINISSSNA